MQIHIIIQLSNYNIYVIHMTTSLSQQRMDTMCIVQWRTDEGEITSAPTPTIFFKRTHFS